MTWLSLASVFHGVPEVVAHNPDPPFEPGSTPFAPEAEAVLRELRDLSAERGQAFVVAYLPTQVDLGSQQFDGVVVGPHGAVNAHAPGLALAKPGERGLRRETSE